MSQGQLSETDRERENDRRRKIWEKEVASYDKRIGWFERRVFGEDNRAWACSRARGEVLEVAVGTGLNLPSYPDDVRVTGIELSPAMLEIAERRAREIGREFDLRVGDAHHLPFEEGTFDSVVCTFSLCNIPDVAQAVAEMKRVLKPGGRLILVDHIRSAVKPVYWVQKVIELFSLRADGDHMTRRPLEQVRSLDFEVQERDRFRWGIVERISAVKPGSN
jgi:ubiquinone/menaquinone biosynthesis C-methylase UbiE